MNIDPVIFVDEVFASDEDEEEAGVAAVVVAAASRASVAISVGVGQAGAHWTGRQIGSRYIQRGICTWFEDYLADIPVYPAWKFRQVFRIPLSLYWVIHQKLTDAEPALRQRVDALGKRGHSSHQKILASLRRLGTGCTLRDLDDQARMSPEALRKAFTLFVRTVLHVFGPRYLNRDPSVAEMRKITAAYAEEGFNGCIGSVDCMHISWKQCPFELKGQYKNPHAGKLATITCEGVCDHNLYCWSWYAGRAGTNNDLTVISSSPLFNRIMSGKKLMKLPEGFELNGMRHDWYLYFLCDGIYPNWEILVGPNHSPLTCEESHMTMRQESVRKDVERFFGCLQGRFKILRRESFEWSLSFLIEISEVCVIIHNMLVELRMMGELEDETDEIGNRVRGESLVREFMNLPTSLSSTNEIELRGKTHTFIPIEPLTLSDAIDRLKSIRSVITAAENSVRLRDALIQHLWLIRKN
jgi:hypothetical protein